MSAAAQKIFVPAMRVAPLAKGAGAVVALKAVTIALPITAFSLALGYVLFKACDTRWNEFDQREADGESNRLRPRDGEPA